MSLETVVDVLLGITPVPGLSAAFTLFKFIVSSVQEVQASKTQLEALAKAIGDLLTTLNSEFKASRLVAAACVKPLDDLRSLVEDVYRFVQKEQDRGFLKSLLNKDSRTAGIEGFYRRIGITVNAFQISALLNVQGMLIVDKRARNQDMDALTARLQNLERSQSELRRTLDINQNNMIAMMVSIERKLDGRRMNDPEHRFYSHTLQYLTSTSGKQVKVEDWMISTFDIDYGPEIGVGGFGKVYRGTWNRTEVAIKVVQNVVGVIPTSEVLRKEIEIWSTLRHPNILQFLGANTLDERPFIVMPYMPSNAREFLRKRPDFDPLYILRDISLGLEYLHSRKICHGDLKGINVLIDDSSRALLCDFGLSRVKSDVASRTNAVDNPATLGSRNWMAPELLTGSLPKLPSDIYAFGMTIYELCTDENPFSSVAYGDFIELVFRLVVRPNRPDVDDFPKLGDSLWSLAERCWVADPKARPTAPNIHDAIIEMISESTRSVVLGSSVSETESTGTVNPQPYSHPIIQRRSFDLPRDTESSVQRDPFYSGLDSEMVTPGRRRHRFRLAPLQGSFQFQPVVCEIVEGGQPLPLTRYINSAGADGRVSFKSKVVSRLHAELSVVHGPEFLIRDTQSGAGTFLNNMRLSPAATLSGLYPIRNGDTVQLGVQFGGRLESIYLPVPMRFETGPHLQNETVDIHGPIQTAAPLFSAPRISSDDTGTPVGASTLVRFNPTPDSMPFDPLSCQLVEGAPALSIMRTTGKGHSSPAIVFRSKTVSRCHAELWTENGDVFIRDTKSLSGTFINGTRISEANEESFEHVLADGDEVRFGAPVHDGEKLHQAVVAKIQLLGVSPTLIPDVSNFRASALH